LILFNESKDDYEKEYIQVVEEELKRRNIIDRYEEFIESNKNQEKAKAEESLRAFTQHIKFNDILYYLNLNPNINESQLDTIKSLFKTIKKQNNSIKIKGKIGFDEQYESSSTSEQNFHLKIYDGNQTKNLTDFTFEQAMNMNFNGDDLTKEMKESIVIEILLLYSNVEIKENESITTNMDDKGFLLRRGFARLLDDIIITVLMLPLIKIIQATGRFDLLIIINIGIRGVIGITYEVIMLQLKSQTIGKMLLNIEIKSKENQKLSFRETVIRTALIRLPYNVIGFRYIVIQAIFLIYVIVASSMKKNLYWEVASNTVCSYEKLKFSNIVKYVLMLPILGYVFVLIGAYLPLFL